MGTYSTWSFGDRTENSSDLRPDSKPANGPTIQEISIGWTTTRYACRDLEEDAGLERAAEAALARIRANEEYIYAIVTAALASGSCPSVTDVDKPRKRWLFTHYDWLAERRKRLCSTVNWWAVNKAPSILTLTCP